MPSALTTDKAIRGGYNDFPPGWTQMTEAEFAKSQFFTHTPVEIEHRQMLPDGRLVPGGPPVVSTHLYWYHDGRGLALVGDYRAGTVAFYRFAICDHALIVTGRPYNCYTEYRCTKCGWQTAVDSSD